MKRESKMIWVTLAALVLVFSATRLEAAASSAETRDWNAARKDFQDAQGSFLAGLAETKFAAFVGRYPNSEHYAEAIVYEARAQYKQGKFDNMIELLAAQWPHAGAFADQFADWTAQAYEAKNDYAKAAENWARLAVETPDSPLRPKAIFRGARAHGILGHWQRVVDELGRPDGPFQQIAQTNQTGELVVKGLILLGQAQLEEKNYKAAEKILSRVNTSQAKELEWERLSLLCRVLLADDRADEAQHYGTNLLAAAGDDATNKASSIVLQGMIQENLGELTNAVRIYEANLGPDLPIRERQEALLRIVDLLLRQNHLDDAVNELNDYLAKYPDEKGADFQQLLLGELQLREFLQARNANPPLPTATNLLQSAEQDFQNVITKSTNAAYVGKAEMNLGWGLWYGGKIPESETAFSNAITHLPFGEDQAKARFKLADILFSQTNYAAAVSNYTLIIEKYPSLPSVKNGMFEQVLYQMVRANLLLNQVAAAEDAMHKILEWFPTGGLGDPSRLLVGEAESSPAEARKVLASFIRDRPQSPLLPEVKLQVARTYERQGDWTNAAAEYQAWVDAYPNDPALPRAAFYRAQAEEKAGDESNAFVLYTNFVARFQSNAVALASDFPALAQFAVGNYFWNQQDYQTAELKYEEVFNKWPASEISLWARLYAGKSAMHRDSWQTAIGYLTNLTSNPQCKPELKASALFALADADTQLTTTNHSNYNDAIGIFQLIATTYTNSPIAAQAWGSLGSCYYTLAGYEAPQSKATRDYYVEATNALQAAVDHKMADVTTRSMAEYHLGEALEKMASLDPGTDRKSLLGQAAMHWLNILHGYNLRENEQADRSWVAEAGRAAGRLMEGLGEWAQAIQIYQELLKSNPSLQKELDKKIDRVRQLQLEKK